MPLGVRKHSREGNIISFLLLARGKSGRTLMSTEMKGNRLFWRSLKEIRQGNYLCHVSFSICSIILASASPFLALSIPPP
jgi:hypothetical protein